MLQSEFSFDKLVNDFFSSLWQFITSYKINFECVFGFLLKQAFLFYAITNAICVICIHSRTNHDRFTT